MLDIALDDRAVESLMTEPALRDWHDGHCGARMPMLRHHHRHTTARADGAVIQRFNFFLLTTIDPHDADEMDGLVVTYAALPNGRTILVGGDATVMSNTRAVAWSNEMFTRRSSRQS